ncbi:MAG: DUF11 domain-containing protein [Chloroflexi bacterium]|nr:MAG: DUF11 domain-containing protein [Chloroflexota bacterium]
MLLSGQDVAYYDSGNSLSPPADYLDSYLMVDFVADTSTENTVNGVAGQPFAGLALSLNGGDGANNQISPDVVTVNNSDFAGDLLQYGTAAENLAGLHVGLCRPYRAVFLAFGLEGINSRSDRSQVMAQSIAWLMQTPPAHGVELTATEGTQIGNFGDTVAHTFRLRNTGAAADTFSLARAGLGPYNWPTSAPSSPVGLASCASRQIAVTVQVPVTKSWHITDSFTISAQSTAAPTLTDVITRYTKTPAPVLLVDDDRWYSFATEFKQALSDNGIPYDYWLVPKAFTGSEPPSPPASTLAMYPMTVWYTAYDWYQPLTVAEEERLIDYLNNSGRLFFSSQDFLYRHKLNHSGNYGPFAQDYLGVLAHTEDFTTTVASGELDNPVGTLLGPYPLTFPAGYQNFTDALTPTTSAGVASRGQADQPNGLTNAGITRIVYPAPTPPTIFTETWRTNFLAYGPELLGRSERARLMQRSVGWLSWLGASTVTAEANSVSSGSWITFTAAITNDGWDDLTTATFTATFPAYLTPGSGTFNWSGPLAVNQSTTFTYTAQINQPLPAGTVISQTSWLAYPAHNIRFDRVAAVPVTPNFSESSLGVTPAAGIQQSDTLTYTLVLRNRGMVGSGAVTTTNTLPNSLQLLGASAQAGTVISSGNALTWTAASLGVGAETTLTVRAVVSATGVGTIRNVAQVDDGFNRAVVLSADASFKVWPWYLPVIVKNATP